MFFDLFYWKKSYFCNRFHHRAMDDVFNENQRVWAFAQVVGKQRYMTAWCEPNGEAIPVMEIITNL